MTSAGRYGRIQEEVATQEVCVPHQFEHEVKGRMSYLMSGSKYKRSVISAAAVATAGAETPASSGNICSFARPFSYYSAGQHAASYRHCGVLCWKNMPPVPSKTRAIINPFSFIQYISMIRHTLFRRGIITDAALSRGDLYASVAEDCCFLKTHL